MLTCRQLAAPNIALPINEKEPIIGSFFFCGIRMRNLSRNPIAWFATGLAFLLAVTALIYAPGLHGPFMFDDFANLPSLGAQGPIDNGQALVRYLVSGNADPTGRPMSVASFLVDARDWPAPSYPFKRDNLILHLLNGCLLALLLRDLGRAINIEAGRSTIAALFGAGAWMLHPLLVSTVLYVVQREAMLPATFCLLAMLTWLRARARIERGGNAGLTHILGIWCFFAAAALSKPNGLLCPALVLISEAALFKASNRNAQRAKRWTWVVAIPGTVVVTVGLLALSTHELLRGVNPVRGWSAAQRLITEPSILMEYIGQLALVVPSPASVFHDQYQAARNLLDPWFTLPAILAYIALVAGAWMCRRRAPAAALAVLFFFVGHAMESTAIPLELYFEHRNYLPSMLLFWPLGLAISSTHSYMARRAIALVVLAAAATLTYQNVLLWADPAKQAVYWASTQPESPRAQAYAAQIEAVSGHPEAARLRIEAAARLFPDEPQVAFALVDIHCTEGSLQPGDASVVGRALEHTQRDPGALLSQWMAHAIDRAKARSCTGVDPDLVRLWISMASANPRINILPGRRQDIAHLSGVVELAANAPTRAASYFRKALLEDPKPEVALNEAALLGDAGEPSLGLQHLEYFDTLPKPPPPSIGAGMSWLRNRLDDRQGFWTNELNNLRAKLSHHVASGS
ncbi:hypothetical protein [Luteibacter sp. 9135]|uniref:hypothetical protein n=1 Tax=Luteibacter sp. 9135 TaxID=1500893 RepID=UPI0006906740|nr:hypothetical protein [Luteibacter sp. 9135]